MRAHLTWLLTWLLISLCAFSSVLQAANKETREPTTPSFNTDGTKMVYVEEVTPGGEVLPSKSEIWTVNSDGTGAKRITQGFQDEDPQFSPDGRQIVFYRDNDIWLINSDGSGARNFSKTKDLKERSATFSNDGQSLFWVEDEFGIDGALIQAPVAGGEKRVLLSDDYGVLRAAPDRNDDKVLIALCGGLTPDGNPQKTEWKILAAIPLNGKAPRVLYDPHGLYEIENFCSGGGRIAVIGNPKNTFDTQTYLLHNGALEKVDKLAYGTGFSADGKTLVGTGLNDKIEWRIAFYYPATKSRTFLEDIAKLGVKPVKAEDFWRRGTEHYKAARYEKALQDLDEALRLDPKMLAAYFNRALVHESQGNRDLALKDYDAALKINPKYVNAHINRGVLLKTSGRTGEALDAYSQAIKWDARNDKAFFNRGVLYLERLEPDAALKDFDKALEIEKEQSIYYLKRGEANLAVGDHQKALADYNKAIELSPERAAYYRGRAAVHTKMGQKTLAQADEAKAQQLER